MQTDLFGLSEDKGAIFSECRNYRYLLTRTWDAKGKRIAFIGLNPSTADESSDDPTIRRCISFAKAWGGGSLLMINLFSLRSTDPKQLYLAIDPIGPDNNKHIKAIIDSSDIIIAAWGNHGTLLARAKDVLEMASGKLQALAVTKSGMPGHPLYLPKNSIPKPYP
ncbi:hypothetical protein PRtIB026_A04580 [Pseudomonas sp. RtIB026]|uniref:DUF1643 domain-containing protein n=1 Tax=Pseudomonas sp. RtIB026 TaxID=2749999 RepID=UPI0019419B6E|nr:DUF1643 domain-containing protein [Pseudomonas sp. RtIB026]BCJ04510.1 hypothetical protein PRtIB026_A04580 [Pseudomonas sp. RtIB026]